MTTASARRYEDATVLALGARGRLRGRAFMLAGRTCVRSSGGGVWNEWSVLFDDGARATLAEARGAFTLYTERPLAPPLAAIRVGAPLDTGFVVVERGEAERVATWGDVPREPRTPTAYAYVDLSSRTGESATIDFGVTPPRVYVGEELTLGELELAVRVERPRFFAVAPKPAPRGLDLALAVGDEGELEGARMRVLGVLARSLRVEGERYTWQEYLLHAPERGFRWLVCADGHWNLVASLAPGLVDEGTSSAAYCGERYRFVSAGRARVDWATGEFPWEVTVGDAVRVRDYVRAPHVLSRESTDDEVTWSLGTYVRPAVVARAFHKSALPKPVGRAPNQPPETTKKTLRR